MFLPAGCTILELFERLRGGDEAPLSDERKDRAWARLTQLASSDEFVFVKSLLPETAYDEIDKDTKTSMWKEIEEKEIEKRAMKLDDPSLRCAPRPAPPDPAPDPTRRAEKNKITIPSSPFHRTRRDAETKNVRVVARVPARDLALGLGDERVWSMKTGSDGRAVLDATARSRHAGVPTSALLNLTKGNDSAQKVAYQVKTLVAAGLVRRREALLDGERREKTSVHYLARFAPAPDFNASVDAEGEQNYLNARDIEEIAAVFAGSMHAHGGERGAMFQSDLGVELYRWLKERKGWTDEEIENPGAKSRIGKIFARVKDHMVEKGTATAIVAIHDKESGDDAGTQLATEHPALRLCDRGGSDDRDGEDGEDGDGFGVGGGELLVTSVIEDQIVALCKAAGDGGLRAHDLAARFKLTAKEFGKKLDLMFKYPNLYGVESTTKQEGKNQVRWIHYAGLKEAAPPGKEKGGGGAAGAKAAGVMMRERQTLLRRHVDERGYVVKMFVPRLMGGWLNKPNPIDSKYVTRLCEDMVATGQLRIESVTVDTVTSLGDAKVQDVLVAVDFPRLTDAVKRRIAVEIAETSKAMKQKWWSRAKDVYAITPPIAPEKKKGEEQEKEKEAPGVSGRELALTSSPASPGPVALLTFKNPGAKPRMRHAAMTDAAVTDPAVQPPGQSPGQDLPFKTFRSLYSLESGYVMANAIRLRYFHAFLVDEIFGGGKSGADFNAGELCMARMPIELFLKLIPAPRKLCEVEAKMLATLQTLALNEKRLGDLTPEQELALVGSRKPPGTLPKARRAAAILTRQEAEKKLANLLKWLQTMGIVEKVDTGIYRLAPEARFQTRTPREDEDDDAPGLWCTVRVDSRAGHEEYWNALEATFKGMSGSKEKDKRGETVAKLLHAARTLLVGHEGRLPLPAAV